MYSVGPVVVGINASVFSFQSYKSGVYNDAQCVGDVNHAVLLVGFGEDERYGKYWKIKNSYGKNYGESGYIRMSRDIPNMCGIWSFVVFPVLN